MLFIWHLFNDKMYICSMIRKNENMKWLLIGSFTLIVLSIIVNACANIGIPSGGPIDTTPPKVLYSFPKNLAVNNTKKKIVINFDEYIKLEKANEKVVISPPQIQQPEIKTSGKKIIVNLLDTLKPKTTYTIDFSDAIQDNNEGNPLGNYAFTFSTGTKIDTMQVSGSVLNAADLEPIKGILVGLHSNLNDSAFTKLPFDRVGRTDSRGQFNIRGIAPGKYRVYALMDADQNFCFSQKSEICAWNDSLIIPYSNLKMRQDTTWIDSITIDTVKARQYTHFFPDNITLRAFKENNNRQSFTKSERLVPHKFSLYFSAPNKDLPKIKGLNFNEKNAFIIEANSKKDTIDYWVKDSVNYKKDTLSLALSYLYTDTLNKLVPRTDTLRLISKIKADAKKVTQKKKKKDADIKPLGLEMNNHTPSEMDVYDYIYFSCIEPIGSYNKKAFHLRQKVDTIYKDIPFDLQQDTVVPRRYNLYYNWVPEKEYEIEVDSAAFQGLYGKVSNKIKGSFKIHSLNDYGDIYFNISGIHGKAFVELLDQSDKVVRSIQVRNNRASFYFLKPGKYFARLIEDSNGNGVWDTGDYSQKLQPENVYYYPKTINLKVLWKIDQEWNVKLVPLNRQKPTELKKQKPDEDKKNKKNNQLNNNNGRKNY